MRIVKDIFFKVHRKNNFSCKEKWMNILDRVNYLKCGYGQNIEKKNNNSHKTNRAFTSPRIQNRCIAVYRRWKSSYLPDVGRPPVSAT